MSKINAVIFDCWDTVINYHETDAYKGIDLLLDISENPNNVTKEELEEDYHKLMHEYYKECNSFDLSFTALFRYICLTHNLKPNVPFEKIEDLYDLHLDPTPVETLKEFLDFLKENNITKGVCSNTIHSEENTIKFVKSCWPTMPFDFIMASSKYGVKKPNPRFFEVGTILANSKKEETIYIGDNFYADVYGSWLAGYKKSIWFNQRHRNKADFYKLHPEMPDNIDYIEIDNYLDLIKILKEEI